MWMLVECFFCAAVPWSTMVVPTLAGAVAACKCLATLLCSCLVSGVLRGLLSSINTYSLPLLSYVSNIFGCLILLTEFNSYYRSSSNDISSSEKQEQQQQKHQHQQISSASATLPTTLPAISLPFLSLPLCCWPQQQLLSSSLKKNSP